MHIDAVRKKSNLSLIFILFKLNKGVIESKLKE